MREFWAFIGCVTIGILAVTVVFAMGEDSKPLSAGGYRDGLDDETEEETNDDESLIARAS